MNNHCLSVIVASLLISVLPSEVALGADVKMPAVATTTRASASATVIDTHVRSCDELLLRTTTSLYTPGSIESNDRRWIDASCRRPEGQGRARLTVEYRDSNGSTVTVTLDDGSVSISPPAPGSQAEKSAAGGAKVLDVLLNYD